LASGKINKVTMNKFLLERDNEREIVLYLYKAGDRYTTNYYRQQINVVLNSILRRSRSAALIEITVPEHEDDLTKTTTVAKKFVKLAFPILYERLP
jgi:EpsI family protein